MGTHASEVEARPLERTGSYRVELKVGPRPAPSQSVPGEALAKYYTAVLASRRALVDEQDEARTSGDYERKYRLKIAISSTEAVAALLHGVVAKAAPFVCGRGCPHLRSGLDPAGCKVFVDALDVAVEELKAENACTAPSHVTHLDERRMIQVYGDWRDRFVELCRETAASTP